MINYHLSNKSTNIKTGKIPVTTSGKQTCPQICPFKSEGCYAKYGPLCLHWEKVSSGERGTSFDEHLREIRKLPKSRLRLFQAGDFPGVGNKINIKQTKKLVNAVKGFEAFGYTHKDLNDKKNKEIIKYCNDNGLTVNLSANNLKHADELFDLKIGPVVVTLPEDSNKNIKTPKNRSVKICPAISSEKVQCSNCGGKRGSLCWQKDRDYIVGFTAHGAAKRRVTEIVA